jgi:glycosyltransferase involved in cell wall biosynthesis
VRFLGHLPPAQLAEALAAAHVYVSVASSDSLALSTMEAMATGAFPVVSDLPSQDGWIEHESNGLRVPVGDVDALTRALERALTDSDLRRRALRPNRELVAKEGSLLANMLAMERHYYRLAGKPLADTSTI